MEANLNIPRYLKLDEKIVQSPVTNTNIFLLNNLKNFTGHWILARKNKYLNWILDRSVNYLLKSINCLRNLSSVY